MRDHFSLAISLVLLAFRTTFCSAQENCNTESGVLALMVGKVILSTIHTPDNIPAESHLPFLFTSELFRRPRPARTSAACFERVSFQIYTSLNASSLSDLETRAGNDANFPLPKGVRRNSLSKHRNGNTITVKGTISKSGYAEGATVYYRLAKRITNCSNCSGQDPTMFSNLSSFTVPRLGPTDIDGNIYEAVFIGDQLWMKENLRVTRYRNGSIIPSNLSDSQWAITSTGALADVNNDSVYTPALGKLYNWYAVADPRGLCPNDWHVPSREEWQTLREFLNDDQGRKMKGRSTLWRSPHMPGSNSSGFTGLPAGARNNFGQFESFGQEGIWWSKSIPEEGTNASYAFIASHTEHFHIFHHAKTFGVSVRCIRNQ